MVRRAFFHYTVLLAIGTLIISGCSSFDSVELVSGCLYGRVVFTKTTDTHSIYIADVTDKIQMQLANDPDEKAFPRWSPDGSSIAFVSFHGKNSEIYRIQAIGGKVVQLTQDVYIDLKPVWSPDGQNIAFVSVINNFGQIFVMASDGSHVRQLTMDNSNSDYPYWSPDGKEIVFVSDRDRDVNFGQLTLYVMDQDGKNQRRLNQDALGFFPAWSPDGRFITYVSDLKSIRKNLERILIYDLQTGISDLLLPGDVGSSQEPGYSLYNPAWSSDGKCVMFIWDAGNPKVYTTDLQTRKTLQVTGLEDVSFLDWITK